MQTLITDPPFLDYDEGQEWHMRGLWPARWIHPESPGPAPFVYAYRKRFTVERDTVLRAHVTADERYELYLDGRMIGRGSEYGDALNWYYETHDLELGKGEHSLVAKVWSLGEMAPYAQMSVKHGFLFAPEGAMTRALGTGLSPWECKRLEGIAFVDPSPAWGTGANLVIDGQRYPWGIEAGTGDDWQRVVAGQPGTNRRLRNNFTPSHQMHPAVLGPMMDRPVATGVARFVSPLDRWESVREQALRPEAMLPAEAAGWDGLIRGAEPIVVPPHTGRRVLFDLEDYYCAYPELTTSGGAGSQVKLEWAEALFNEADGKTKGNRDAIEGKYFYGTGDVFKPDGGTSRAFRTLWWQAGRYVQLCVQTADQPLVIESLHLRETRYPLETQSVFACSDDRLNRVIPIALRALHMCSHETYIDCPYYEQLMYSGDSRLKALTTLVTTRDDRLLRKSIDLFDHSRLSTGLTQARYPSRFLQIITPFSLFWIGMVHDYALWRDDRPYVKARMPGVRGVLEAMLAMRGTDGLIQKPDGWNFMDWVPTWDDGVHPGMEYGPSAIINLQLVYVLQLAAKLESWLDEPELERRWTRVASELMQLITARFWVERRGLFADDIDRKHFSEHAQCFAVLSGMVPEDQRAKMRDALTDDTALCRTTFSFTHYLFETYRLLDLMPLFYNRLSTWYELEKLGFKTTPEQPEPTRSDCHGWASHPIYHCFATILGIRPVGMGFHEVEIEPRLDPLTEAHGTLIHPAGAIEVDLFTNGPNLEGSVTLPRGVQGIFKYRDFTKRLLGGSTEVFTTGVY